jgi:toxin-antitoxin system PIN domain toxin
MIAVDTNLLIYAHRADSDFHDRAFELVETLRHSSAAWSIPWPCVHEFIAIATHPRIYKPASLLAEAFGFLDAIMASPTLHLLAESPGYYARLQEISATTSLKGPQIHDARIAALCLHHGVSELWSSDRDFRLFPKLRVRNPLLKA